LDFDTFVKDSSKLALEPFMDSEKKIFGLDFIYLCPFVVFYKVPENLEESGLAQDNFNLALGIPYQRELMQIYEDFFQGKFPKKPILTLKRQCKPISVLKV
jgi:hypothetical protein